MEIGMITHRKTGKVVRVVSMPAVHVPYPRMLQTYLQSEGLNPDKWEDYYMNASPITSWDSVVARTKPILRA